MAKPSKEQIEEYYSKAMFIQDSIKDFLDQNKLEIVGGTANNFERILKTNSNNLLELQRSRTTGVIMGGWTFYFLRKTVEMNLEAVEEMHKKIE